MDINTAQRQMHITDNPGYVMTDVVVASAFDSPPDIEAAWEKEIARRRQEVLDGTVKLVDGEEVIRRSLEEFDDHIVIYAIAHTKRKPGYWRERMNDNAR